MRQVHAVISACAFYQVELICRGISNIFHISVVCLQIDHVTTKETAYRVQDLPPLSPQNEKNMLDSDDVGIVKLQILQINVSQCNNSARINFLVVIYYVTFSLPTYSYIDQNSEL